MYRGVSLAGGVKTGVSRTDGARRVFSGSVSGGILTGSIFVTIVGRSTAPVLRGSAGRTYGSRTDGSVSGVFCCGRPPKMRLVRSSSSIGASDLRGAAPTRAFITRGSTGGFSVTISMLRRRSLYVGRFVDVADPGSLVSTVLAIADGAVFAYTFRLPKSFVSTVTTPVIGTSGSFPFVTRPGGILPGPLPSGARGIRVLTLVLVFRGV